MSEQSPTAPETEQASLTADDLAMLDPALDDAGKTEGDLWQEFEDAEASDAGKTDAAASDDEPAASDDQDPAAVSKDGASADRSAQPTPQAVDIWATATPEQKAAFEAAIAERDKAHHRERSEAGRRAALQRRVDELRGVISSRPADKPAKERKDPREALSAIKDDLPEVYEALAPVVETIGEDVTQLSAAEKRRIDAAQQELGEIVQAETAAVLERHPDGFDVINKNPDAFRQWIVDQPHRVRQAAERNWSAVTDAEGLITVLDGFKAHLGQPAAARPAAAQAQPEQKTATIDPPTTELNDRRKRQLAGSAAPAKSGGRPTVSGIPEDGDPQAIWDAFEAQERGRA